jgi:hypothetical protein
LFVGGGQGELLLVEFFLFFVRKRWFRGGVDGFSFPGSKPGREGSWVRNGGRLHDSSLRR